MRPGTRIHWTNLQRVYLGVVFTSDPTGLFCLASNAEIGRAAGRIAPATVARHLASLEGRSVIATFPDGDLWTKGRVILIRDHPDFEEGLAAMESIRRDDGPWHLRLRELDPAPAVVDLLRSAALPRVLDAPVLPLWPPPPA